MLRFLVIEGNTTADRARHAAAGSITASAGYAALLQALAPGAQVDCCFPADLDADLPTGAALDGYDGAAITGSALHAYEAMPEVTRQIELTRAVMARGIPMFGSCWGLQILTVAAGGAVRRNPLGREVGIGRDIQLTAAGRGHPMYAGKADRFEAITIHLDEVATLAPGMTVLAGNAMSRVQSAEIRHPAGIAWGVQYHPEYTLGELAAITRWASPRLIGEGIFVDAGALDAFASDLDILDRDGADIALAHSHGIDGAILDVGCRTREIANWIYQLVRPAQQARGRG